MNGQTAAPRKPACRFADPVQLRVCTRDLSREIKASGRQVSVALPSKLHCKLRERLRIGLARWLPFLEALSQSGALGNLAALVLQ